MIPHAPLGGKNLAMPLYCVECTGVIPAVGRCVKAQKTARSKGTEEEGGKNSPFSIHMGLFPHAPDDVHFSMDYV